MYIYVHSAQNCGRNAQEDRIHVKYIPYTWKSPITIIITDR